METKLPWKYGDVSSDFPNIDIQMVNIHDLKKNPRHARRHTSSKIRKLAKFISVTRLIYPLLIDKNGNIIAGHARLEAAKLLGRSTVPCIRIEHLDENMLRAFALADNQFTLSAGWDQKAVREELVFLSNVVLEYGLELTDVGFPTAELDIRIGDQALLGPEDEIMEPETKAPAITKQGYVWALGSHRLICGDSRDREVYQLLMRNERAIMVFADAPYNVPIDGHVCGAGSIKHAEFAMASGEMTREQFIAFLFAFMILLREFSTEGSIHFQCMDWRHVYEMESAALQAGYVLINLCVWIKDNGGMGSLYRSRHELVFVYKSGDAPHINNVELGKHGLYRTNCWEYPGVNSFRNGRMDELALHPTVKPVAMVADAIKDCSPRDGIVLDPFGGSGTTLIAAEQTGRKARLIEIDPHYCDVIVRRWQSLTGQKAVLESTGQTFDELLPISASTETMEV